MQISDVKALLKAHKDFPKEGILFQDIFPIFQHPEAVLTLVEHIVDYLKDLEVDAIVGLEARGFLLGPWIAVKLGIPFLPVRKQGKLPGQCVQVSYEKEYGIDIFEMQADSMDLLKLNKPSPKVAVLDDLLATGGTALAAKQLVSKLGATVEKFIFFIELTSLKGAEKVGADSVYSLMKFD